MTLTLRQLAVAVRFLVVTTVVLGVLYPGAVWLAGRAVPARADGSYVTDATGRVIGSSLIGQSWSGPQWFHSRPSAADYDALASGGSNLALDNSTLVEAIRGRQHEISTSDDVPVDRIPPDAVTASGSGLDPDISPEYATEQVARVASSRRLDPTVVAALVSEHTVGRTLGFIGEPHVNVLELNLALEQMP